MNIASRVKGAIAALQGKGYAGGGSGIDFFEYMTDADRTAYMSWVYGCVSRIATSVSSVPLRLYKATSDNRAQWKEIENSELLDLLDNPNEIMDRTEFMQYLSMQESLTGHSFCLLGDVKDAQRAPRFLLPLDPLHMKIKKAKAPKLIAGYEYFDKDTQEELTYQKYEIMRSRMINPRDVRGAYGPAQGAANSIASDTSARMLAQRMFKNGGMPGLILETDIMSEEHRQALRNSFNERHGGEDNAYKMAVLPPGVKIGKEGVSGRDMEFSELRRISRDEILAIFGVPPIVMGLGLGESINRATAEVQEYVYARYTVLPALKRREAALNRALTYRYGQGLVLEYDNPVPEDVERQITKNRAALASEAWMSINEVRNEMGLPPIKGGDSIMGSSMIAPVGQTSPEKAKTQYFRRYVSNHEKAEVKMDEAADRIAKAIATTTKEQISAIRKSVTQGDWKAQWEAFVKRSAPHEKDMRSAMQEYAKGMTKRALASFNEQTKALDPGQIIDRDEEITIIIDLLTPIYEKILVEEGKSAADLIGAAFDDADETIRDALAKSIKLMADKYTQETMDLLQNALEEGIAEDYDLEELASRIDDVGALSESSRADRVAKTEAFRTANFATRSAWQQSGVVSSVMWYTAEDEMVCEFCGPMSGKIVGIDENFFDKNQTVTGSEGGTISTNYAAVENPPLHPNCRCYIRPEAIDE